MKSSQNGSFRNTAKLKKRIIIVVVAVLAAILFLFALLYLMEFISSKIKESNEQAYKFNFSDADYEEDIFTDTEYLDKISCGFISYCDVSTNITIGIDRDTCAEYGKDVAFLVEYIYHMINGETDAYNACYSENYFKNESPASVFTMQKIYDVYITKQLEEKISKDGAIYTNYSFILEYKILDNNGTLRNDMGSGSKKQYIIISDRTGNMLIDSVSTNNIRN